MSWIAALRNRVFGLVENPRPRMEWKPICESEVRTPCRTDVPQTGDPAFRFPAFLTCLNIKRSVFPTYRRFSLPDASH